VKILVTGSSGFLGSWISTKLLDLGHSVVGVDNLEGGSYQDPREDFHCLDVCSGDDMAEVAKGCEAVYHCAALAYEGLSVFSPRMIVENIVGGTVSVAVAAINAGVKRFVNCSSMARYGDNQVPYEECMRPCPVDPYGAAKVAAEDQLNLLGRVHGMMVVHAVPHNIYGPRQKYDDPFRNVASIFANRMLQNLPPIIYGDGHQVRCFSYIDDVLPTMLALLEADVRHGEVFNVGPGNEDGITVNRLCQLLRELTGYTGGSQYTADRPCEVRVAICSSQKIKERFGFVQRTGTRLGLRALIDDIRERGPKPFVYHLPIEIDSPKVPRTWKERLM